MKNWLDFQVFSNEDYKLQSFLQLLLLMLWDIERPVSGEKEKGMKFNPHVASSVGIKSN